MTVPTGAHVVDDPGDLAELYSDNIPAHIYALVDLEEPFWSASRWLRRRDAAVGVVHMPSGEGSAVYAVSTKGPDGSLSLLADLVPSLPSGLLVTGPVGLAEALAPHRDLAWDGPHVRYHLTDASAMPPADDRLVALGADHLPALESLYASDPGAAFFLPHMVDDDGFVGIYEGDDLVAAAGTHVMSTRQGCAAIGAVYTRPSHRGRGLGGAVTAGVIHRISDRVTVIGLNVAADNAPARAIYEGIGFTKVLPYDECELA